MKRALGVMMLALLACGPGADTPTSSPAGPEKQSQAAAEKGLREFRDSYVWGDASQPPHDWDSDAEACKERVEADLGQAKKAHALVKIAALAKCMQEMGWKPKGENR